VKISWIIVCFLLAEAIMAADIRITEVMATPEGGDDGHEWLEIINAGYSDVDFSGWKFYEAGTAHGITLAHGSLTIAPGGIAVIADNATDFIDTHPGYTGSVIDSSWGTLSDSGEEIGLKDPEANIVSFIYPDISEEGYSIELLALDADPSVSSSWDLGPMGGSPGTYVGYVDPEEPDPEEPDPEEPDPEEPDPEDSEDPEQSVPEFGVFQTALVIAGLGIFVYLRR